MECSGTGCKYAWIKCQSQQIIFEYIKSFSKEILGFKFKNWWKIRMGKIKRLRNLILFDIFL